MKKLKIGQKISLLTIFMLSITILVGIFGIRSLYIVNSKSNNISGFWMPGILVAQDINQNISDYRIFEYMYIGASSEEELLKYEPEFERLNQELENLYSKYNGMAVGAEDMQILENIKLNWSKYLEFHKQVLIFSQNVNSSEGDVKAFKLMSTQSKEIYNNLTTEVKKLIDFNNNGTNDEITYSNNLFKIIIILLAGTIIAALVISFLLSRYILKSIVNPINKIKDIANKVANGDLNQKLKVTNGKTEIEELTNSFANLIYVFDSLINDINKNSEEFELGDIDSKIDISKYNGDYKNVAQAINDTTSSLINDLKKSMKCIEKYADGNFDYSIERFPGKKATIHTTLDNVKKNLKSVDNDINLLINALSNGDFSKTIDSSKYKANWKDMVNNLNNLITIVSTPIIETSNILNKVSEGDLNVIITGNYSGEFEVMKKSVNKMINNNSSYINEISDVLIKMSEQNLNVSIEREYIGDFGKIKTALDTIIQKFNHLINDISSSAEQIANGASQISNSSISLAQGATEQTGSIEKLNISVEKLLEESKNNTSNSNKSKNIALITKDKAQSSGNQMNSMLKAMKEISASSNNINNIIKVIDDIAFQTNILALNAAVEAARAGEHGKGFAVVAEEVRNLASKSQDAVKETSDLIKTVVNKINEGSELAVTTSSELSEVVEHIKKIFEYVEYSATSSQEQETSIDQIYHNIEEISSVTQTNSATSEESAAAAQELSGQSELFKNLVGKFILKPQL